MNKTIGLQLIVYSLLLGGFSCFTHYLAPPLSRPTLIAGLAGALLCLLWGLRAVFGSRGKALPILTLIPVNFVLLSQTVMGWSGGSQDRSGQGLAAVVTTILFALSIGMLMRIAYAGAAFDGQNANSARDADIKPQTTGRPATLKKGEPHV